RCAEPGAPALDQGRPQLRPERGSARRCRSEGPARAESGRLARGRRSGRDRADQGGVQRPRAESAALRLARALVLASVSLLGACHLGPFYRRPPVDMPVSWKLEAPWRQSTPSDTVPKGQWWKRFGDGDLDALIEKALKDSPTLAAANARLTQSRAILAGTSAGLFPQVTLQSRANSVSTSGYRPLTRYNTPNFHTTQEDFALQLGVSYELDLFGRVRRVIEGARASAEQSAADLENVRLLLTTDVATAYFNLRQVDTAIDVLTRS